MSLGTDCIAHLAASSNSFSMPSRYSVSRESTIVRLKFSQCPPAQLQHAGWRNDKQHGRSIGCCRAQILRGKRMTANVRGLPVFRLQAAASLAYMPQAPSCQARTLPDWQQLVFAPGAVPVQAGNPAGSDNQSKQEQQEREQRKYVQPQSAFKTRLGYVSKPSCKHRVLSRARL